MKKVGREYIVLDLLDKMFKFRSRKNEKWIRYYYTVKIPSASNENKFLFLGFNGKKMV